MCPSRVTNVFSDVDIIIVETGVHVTSPNPLSQAYLLQANEPGDDLTGNAAIILSFNTNNLSYAGGVVPIFFAEAGYCLDAPCTGVRGSLGSFDNTLNLGPVVEASGSPEPASGILTATGLIVASGLASIRRALSR